MEQKLKKRLSLEDYSVRIATEVERKEEMYNSKKEKDFIEKYSQNTMED